MHYRVLTMIIIICYTLIYYKVGVFHFPGKPPFYSDNYSKLIEMILHQEPPPPRQTGDTCSLTHIVRTRICLHTDAESNTDVVVDKNISYYLAK